MRVFFTRWLVSVGSWIPTLMDIECLEASSWRPWTKGLWERGRAREIVSVGVVAI